MLVFEAKNGKEAISQVIKHNLDIILMDIQMPVMDGYDATKYIRQHSKLTDLPIIALSANVMKKDELLSKEAGMNEHLAKPIRVEPLINTLVKFL